MFIRTAMLAAATAVGLSGIPVEAATYTANSFIQTKKKKTSHSIKFSKRSGGKVTRLEGGRGKNKRNFKLEKSSAAVGSFVTSGSTARLTGTVYNRAGQGFDMVVNFDRVQRPGAIKKKRGQKVSAGSWSFYTISSGTLTSMTGELANFDLFQSGFKRRRGKRVALATQVGVGANVNNGDLLGLFTSFKAKEQGCDPLTQECQKYKGHLKLALTPDNSGSSGGGGTPSVSAVPVPASILMLPVALGLLGAMGGVARRRRRS